MGEQLYMQQHVQTLQRYICALEGGDVETIATILNDAEQDHALERMLLEVNAVYQHEDHTIVRADDLAAAQQLLFTTIDQATRRDIMSIPSLNGKNDPAQLELSNNDMETELKPIQPLQGRKFATPVFPARMVASQKWYHSRKGWIAASAAAVLIALLLLPGTSAMASQFLSLFRIQQFQPVHITQQDMKTALSQYSAPTLEDIGSVQFQSNSFQAHNNLTQAQAASSVSFPITLPRQLPQGISNDPSFSITGGGHGVFTFSSAKMHAYLVKNKHNNVQIPANLDGATFSVTATSGVMVKYGYRAANPFVIVEEPSPVIQATGSASLSQLRDFLLSLPGLPPQLVAQLKQIDFNSGTFPLPIPAGITTQSITVHGTSGLLLSSTKTTSIEQIEQFPAGGKGIVWQAKGIIYALGGITVSTDQLIAAANSL